MSEPTWWQLASPVWLFRVKPADFTDSDGICPGLLYTPGLLALVFFHVAFLGFPVAILIRVGWYPGILWLTVPVALLWAVFVPADIKFRLQRPTRHERDEFDKSAVNWFGFVFWAVTLPVGAVLTVIGLVWWVVSVFN